MAQQHAPNSRLMQVKVLYTFNDENKSNCLARCQQPTMVQTAKLDPSTEVGIIELRTCIQAIVSASPELVAKLGQDYTIYAYDYSEYETPLVGQGMLSWVLASASSTPTAPADQSHTMVTGRVTKNGLALFSPTAKETLEVKLRLVPVPTCLQSEYLAGIEKYRNASTVATQNFDTAAWTTFLQANPNFGAVENLPSSAPTAYHAPQPRHPPAQFPPPSNPHFNPNHHTIEVNASSNAQQAGQNPNAPASSSRPTTPSGTKPKAPRKRNPPSRPASRASRAKPASKQSASSASRVEFGQAADTSEAEETQREEGPTRKRARVTQTDWNGTSNFGAGGESLRVTATTAASIRNNQLPTTGHPAPSDIVAGEVGDRPPTPRPNLEQALPPVAIPRATKAVTNKGKSAARASSIRSDAIEDPAPESSPEKRDESTASTPFEFPSSPPVMHRPSPTPSSPPLPRLPGNQDSGFVSGTVDEDLFEDNDPLPPVEIPHQYKKKPEIKAEPTSPGRSSHDTEPVPMEVDLETNLSQQLAATNVVLGNSCPPQADDAASTERSQSAQASVKVNDSWGELQADESVSNDKNNDGGVEHTDALAFPALLRQDSVSIAVDNQSPEAVKPSRPPKQRQNSVTHEKKKRAIQDNLTAAIQKGQMPRYCKNCGAISTPTWRIVFAKVLEGPPDTQWIADPENGIVAWEPVDKDEDGTIKSHRVIKKSASSDEAEFHSVDLCNSCGVWLFRNKVMRPAEAWVRAEMAKPPPKSKSKKGKKGADGLALESEAQSEANNEASRPGTAIDESKEDLHISSCEQDEERIANDCLGSNKKPRVERANSVGIQQAPRPAASILLDKSSAAAALRRAIQSSPPRFPGSKYTPIEIDTSPQPTRRLLFPSPRKPGELKSLEDPVEGQKSPTARISWAKDAAFEKVEERGGANSNKDDDGLEDLFTNADLAEAAKDAAGESSSNDLLKTPSRNSVAGSARKTGHLTSAAKRWQPNISEAATPSRGANNDFDFTIGQMTPFTRRLTELISDANMSSEDNDPTFDPLNPEIDVPGIFTFSDFAPEDFIGAGPDDPNAALFGFFDHQEPQEGEPSSEGLWEGNIESAMDAFLETGNMEEPADAAAAAVAATNEESMQ